MTKPLRSRRWFDNPDNDDSHDTRGEVNRSTVIKPRAPRMPVRRALPQLFFRHAQPPSRSRRARADVISIADERLVAMRPPSAADGRSRCLVRGRNAWLVCWRRSIESESILSILPDRIQLRRLHDSG